MIPLKPMATLLPIVAGMAFLTPIGMPPTLLVQTAGNYSFFDYTRAGWALQIVSMACVGGWICLWIKLEKAGLADAAPVGGVGARSRDQML